MIKQQMTMVLSPYMAIYDLIIPKGNLLRRFYELVDFSFIYQELEDKYCLDNGRNAIPPIRMFKYLLLKSIYDISDRDVVERSQFDMSFKYFLDMAPEETVINPSSLTKFRKQRLKDVNLMDMLISKSVSLAIEKGVVKSDSIIMDATHTVSRFCRETPIEILRSRSKKLRKAVYAREESIKENMPEKNTSNSVEDEIEYCNRLINTIKESSTLPNYPDIKEKINLLQETVDDTIGEIQSSNDEDAKTGHKSADSEFFGFKTHIAMTEERIITAALVTSGEKNDGKYLESLLEKSRENGVMVNEIIGDTAYSTKDNIIHCNKEKIKLISKLNPTVTHLNNRNNDKFSYNKDSEMYVCPAGHMAIRKSMTSNRFAKENDRLRYYFDIEKCKLCRQKEGCYREGIKAKTFSVAIMSPEHTEQMSFQESDYFKVRTKERYKIEAKNSELKNRHGYSETIYTGLKGMNVQGATVIFTANIKRILNLITK